MFLVDAEVLFCVALLPQSYSGAQFLESRISGLMLICGSLCAMFVSMWTYHRQISNVFPMWIDASQLAKVSRFNRTPVGDDCHFFSKQCRFAALRAMHQLAFHCQAERLNVIRCRG